MKSLFPTVARANIGLSRVRAYASGWLRLHIKNLGTI